MWKRAATTFKGIAVILNAVISALMLLIYLIPSADPSDYWMLNLLPLLLPFFIVLQIFFFVFWFFVRRKWILIPLLSILACAKPVTALFGFHIWNSNTEPPSGSIQITGWNVHTFGFFTEKNRLNKTMLSYIKDLHSDIFCAQELVFSLDENDSLSLNMLKKKLGFKYVYTGNDSAFGVYAHRGPQSKLKYHPFCLAIFSNYPILRAKKTQPVPEYNHTFIWVDLQIGMDTVRVFNIHLQSLHFVKKDYAFIENIDQQNVDSVSNGGRTILMKMKDANFQRAIQVLAVKDELRRSPYPVILCGDFNDVPNSYAYQTIRSELRDAFSDKGYGIGRTFRYLAPTLRVDYIFYHPSFQIKSFQTGQITLSDHKPVTAVFEASAIR